MPSSFLIIQTAFIGDVVLATAIAEKLRETFPDAAIDFLVRKGNEKLLEGNPVLREVLIWNKTQSKYQNLFSLLRKIRNKKYDTVINLQRFAATGMLTAFSGATNRIGFDKNPFSRFFSKKVAHLIGTKENPVHEVERNQELIKDITGNHSAKPRLYPSAQDKENVRLYQSVPYVCIAPASVWFTKQYPPEKWASIIKKLSNQYNVYLMGAESDRMLCEKITTQTGHQKSIYNLCGNLSFLESAALLEKATMNFVNDSAPLHFASAVNAPVTAVYCSTIPEFGFGPLSDIRFIIETEEKLDCRPCGLHGRSDCPLGHFKCAYTIRDEQLLNSLLVSSDLDGQTK